MGSRVQSVILLVVLAIFIAQPALACLAPRQMSQSEMACCRQMAGDCDMSNSASGAGHSCCKDVVHSNVVDFAPVSHGTATMPNAVWGVVHVEISVGFPPAIADAWVHQGSPPPGSPPAASSILRI